MSIVSSAVEVPKAIIKPLMNPKTLLIGAGITAGSLFILSAILPGIGQWVGLRTNPLLPSLHPSLNFWPFAPMPMNGGGAAVTSASSGGPSQEELGRAIVASSVNSAQGYVNAMLQVT
jgi:hypothetical protein